jgi:hypothetical protein
MLTDGDRIALAPPYRQPRAQHELQIETLSTPRMTELPMRHLQYFFLTQNHQPRPYTCHFKSRSESMDIAKLKEIERKKR